MFRRESIRIMVVGLTCPSDEDQCIEEYHALRKKVIREILEYQTTIDHSNHIFSKHHSLLNRPAFKPHGKRNTAFLIEQQSDNLPFFEIEYESLQEA